MKVKLQDSKNNEVVIHLGDFPLPSISQNSLKIDCVTISPRYDHGFGFSQLYTIWPKVDFGKPMKTSWQNLLETFYSAC